MNKSKILKRSLAIVLSLMMIVAMIPLSASAATAPKVYGITVASSDATGSGNAWEAKVSTADKDDFGVVVVLEGDAGLVYYDGAPAAHANGQFTINEHLDYEDDLSNGKLQFQIFDAEGGNAATVTLTISVTNADTDATLKTFTLPGQYGATVFDHTANTITLTVPYNYTPDYPTVAANSSKVKAITPTGFALADPGDGSQTLDISDDNTITVESEAGSTKTYTIIVKAAEGFSAFSVAGQRKAASIEKTPLGVDAPKEIYVYMPYGTAPNSDHEFAFTPTFTTGYPSVKVTATTLLGKDVTLTSGKEVELSDYIDIAGNGDDITADPLTVTLTYNAGETETWKIHFDVPAQDPVAAIKSAKVGNYAAEISGTTISLALPSAVRKQAPSMDVVVSKNVSVQVTGGAAVKNAADDTGVTLTPIDLTKDTQSLLVETQDEDGNRVTATYTLKISTKEAEQAQLKAFSLQDADGNTYDATINQTTGEVKFTTVPFAVDDPAKLVAGGYKIFYTITNGSVAPYLDVTGSKITAAPGGTAALFPTAFDGKTKDGDEFTVVTPNADGTDVESLKTYYIVVGRANAARGATLTSFTLTSKNDIDDVTSDNSIKVTPTSAKALTINVADSKYANYSAAEGGAAYAIAAVADKAKLYYKDAATEKLTEIVSVAEDAVATALPEIAGYDGTGTPAKTLTLVVLSQQAQSLVDLTAKWDVAAKASIQSKGGNASDYNEYTLTVVHKDPQSGSAIQTFSLYNKALEKSIKATINTSTRVISATVPYGWLNTPLVADYTTFHDSLVYSNGTTVPFNKYEVDADGAYVTGSGTEFGVVDEDGTLQLIGGGTDLEALWAVSEDKNDKNNYTFNIKVDAAKTGASLVSATINNVTARPVGQNVTINLPYGTEITALPIKFVVSDNAVVEGPNGDLHKDTTTYNFTTPLAFKVHSEDQKNETTYTVTVTTNDQFDDVKAGAWYYEEVMEAAEKGIVLGYNGKFTPNGLVTRGQFAQFLARADGYDADEYEDLTRFTDVTAGTEQAAAITYCYDKGYISGKGDNTFAPNANITRQEVATILAKFLGLSAVESGYTPVSDDAQISSWAKGYVYAVLENGAMVGNGTGFNPLGNATRAEAAAVCVRVTK